MAAYSPTILTGSTANYTALYNALTTELAVERGSDVDSSARTIASSTATALHSTTITLESDEIIETAFHARISGGTSADVMEFKWFIDSTSILPVMYWEADTSSTSSDKGSISITNKTWSKSGNISFAVQWRRFAGSGTLYCSYSKLEWAIYKQRS